MTSSVKSDSPSSLPGLPERAHSTIARPHPSVGPSRGSAVSRCHRKSQWILILKVPETARDPTVSVHSSSDVMAGFLVLSAQPGATPADSAALAAASERRVRDAECGHDPGPGQVPRPGGSRCYVALATYRSRGVVSRSAGVGRPSSRLAAPTYPGAQRLDVRREEAIGDSPRTSRGIGSVTTSRCIWECLPSSKVYWPHHGPPPLEGSGAPWPTCGARGDYSRTGRSTRFS